MVSSKFALSLARETLLFSWKKSRSTTTFEAENENRRRSSFGTLEAGLFLDHTPHYDRRAAEQR